MPLALGACALAASAAARGQDTISIGRVAVTPGDGSVVVPVAARTSSVLTGLNVQIGFAPALCASIDAIEVRRAGRTLIEPEEGGVRCPQEGRVSLVLFNPRGEAAVPAGDGPIAELRFDVGAGAVAGSFPLSLVVDQSRNGPRDVALAPVDGALTVARACAADCNGDLTVGLNELVLAVNVALDRSPAAACGRADADRDGRVSIVELVRGVGANMAGSCPS
jgi:hypothetical protein